MQLDFTNLLNSSADEINIDYHMNADDFMNSHLCFQSSAKRLFILFVL